MFFYQRTNFAKQPPYADPKWADGAAFSGANQDYAARSRWDKTNAATAKDLHGGWFDAGDYNKYTTFTFAPLCTLLETYRMHPSYFGDDYNIPESGNGIPDMLDELQYEIDWLKRMQDASGTNGLFLKCGVDNFNTVSPPSGDTNPRYYVPECTSSTLTGCAVFALGSTVYKSIPSMTTYGNDLLTRSVNAWNRAKVTTSNFTIFQTSCDDQNIKSGDADQDIASQKDMVVTAAAYLYEATGSNEYRNCFDTMYSKSQPYSSNWWGPYYPAVERALLRYTKIAAATVTVANNIKNQKANQNGVLSVNDYNNQTDLYRSFMPDGQYHWGSNQVKANAGLDNFDFATFTINAAQSNLYKETGESYLHWFHGVNPMGKVMLSNMYAYGGDSCVNEFYHSWFGNGTIWDNVFTSLYGPPPGYVPGGPNKDFSILSMSPPAGQPPQKAYKEWNTGWNGVANENSWEITEPAIYYQAAYISLLVRVMATGLTNPLPLHRITLTAERNASSVLLKWEADNTADSKLFEAERSTDGINFIKIGEVNAETNITRYYITDNTAEAGSGTVYYRIKETGLQGEVHISPIIKLTASNDKDDLSVYPNPGRGEFTLNGYASSTGLLVVRIFDLSGKLVQSANWMQSKGTWSRNISVDDIPAGMYYVQVSNKEKSVQVKISKL